MSFNFGGEEFAFGEIENAHKESIEKFLNELKPEVKNRVLVLKKIQEEHEKKYADYQKKLFELRMQFENDVEPLYKRRNEIVVGESDVTEEEIKNVEKPEKVENSTEKGIPGFWKQVIMNSEPFQETVQVHDEPILDLLQNIKSVMFSIPNLIEKEKNNTEEKKSPKEDEIYFENLEELASQYSGGFQLQFEFVDPKENPFFSNKILKKTYFFDIEDGEMITKAESEPIKWKSDEQNVTQIKKVKTQKKKGGGKPVTRKITVTEPQDSFFHFFDNLELDSYIEEKGKEILKETQKKRLNDDEEDMLREEFEQDQEDDFEIGQMLKEKIIPNAVEYFLNIEVALPGMDGDFDFENQEEGEKGEGGFNFDFN